VALQVNTTAQAILEALNREKIRATYGAVAEVLGIQAWSVGQVLGAPRVEASWVVNAHSGLPTGYKVHQRHPDLMQNAAVIRTGERLRRLLDPATRH
jgi:alkylated DNA nucleotide flippase Atl1